MPIAAATHDSRHPFELLLIILCVIGSPAIIWGSATPGSIQAALSSTEQDIWGGILMFGGVVSLAGVLWPKRTNGLLMEQVGMVAIGVGMVMYCVAVGVTNGVTGLFASSLSGMIALACFIRWGMIQKSLKRAGVLARRRGGR